MGVGIRGSMVDVVFGVERLEKWWNGDGSMDAGDGVGKFLDGGRFWKSWEA